MGGTKILAGVFTTSLECVGRTKMSTKAERGPVAVIERIARCVQDAVDECDLELKQVRGVGIGAPGAVDPENGRVIFAGNLGWKDIAAEEGAGKAAGPAGVSAKRRNLCALGVHEVELEGKPRNMVGIFLGTGIGAGLILDGKLYSGFNRTAGEVGPHGAGGRRPQMRLRQPRLLGGAGQPHRHFPPDPEGGRGGPKNRPDRNARQ